jgi:hypothetical protein
MPDVRLPGSRERQSGAIAVKCPTPESSVAVLTRDVRYEAQRGVEARAALERPLAR